MIYHLSAKLGNALHKARSGATMADWQRVMFAYGGLPRGAARRGERRKRWLQWKAGT